jgi:hypothetical protein
MFWGNQSFTDSNVNSVTDYNYRVTAYQGSMSCSANLQVRTPECRTQPAPPTIRADCVETANPNYPAIELSWGNVDGDEILLYEWDTRFVRWELIATRPVGIAFDYNYLRRNVRFNRIYRFRASTRNAGFASNWGPEVRASCEQEALDVEIRGADLINRGQTLPYEAWVNNQFFPAR